MELRFTPFRRGLVLLALSARLADKPSGLPSDTWDRDFLFPVALDPFVLLALETFDLRDSVSTALICESEIYVISVSVCRGE